MSRPSPAHPHTVRHRAQAWGRKNSKKRVATMAPLVFAGGGGNGGERGRACRFMRFMYFSSGVPALLNCHLARDVSNAISVVMGGSRPSTPCSSRSALVKASPLFLLASRSIWTPVGVDIVSVFVEDGEMVTTWCQPGARSQISEFSGHGPPK